MPENFDTYLQKKENKSQKIYFSKNNTRSPRYSTPTTTWDIQGLPEDGIITTATSYYDKTSTGALQFKNADTGKNLYLTDVTLNTNSTIILYDRFFSKRFDLQAGTKTITTQTYTRNNGLADFVFLECLPNQSSGGSNTNILLNYTNNLDIIKVASNSFPVSSIAASGFILAGTVFPLGLTDGDRLFKTINSIQFGGNLTAAVGPSGYFWCITMGRLIGVFSKNSSPLLTSYKKIENDSCLALLTSNGLVSGCFTLIEE